MLAVLAEELDRSTFPVVERILQENWRRGRMQKFLAHNGYLPEDYAHRVFATWQQFHEDVHQIQVARADEVWEGLYRKMVAWNYRYLLRCAANSGSQTREFAEYCASETVPTLLTAYFPYDVHLEAWLRVIVLNACRKQIRNERRSAAIPAGQLLDLEVLPEETSPETPGSNPDLGLDLAAAILHLNPARQEVIRLLYLEGLSIEEAARQLGKTHSSIYNLHFQAVKELRKHMQDWIKHE